MYIYSRLIYTNQFMKNKIDPLHLDSRRTFLMQGSLLAGSYLVQPQALFDKYKQASWTVGQVMDKFIS